MAKSKKKNKDTLECIFVFSAHSSPTLPKNTKILVISGEEVDMKRYPATAEGMIKSWVERFPNTEIDDILELLADRDSKYFQELQTVIAWKHI